MFKAFVLPLLLLCSARLACAGANCGYQTCNLGDENSLNVHLVPHTHDDVGWLKTVDQYYYGANQKIVQAGVQYILDSVVSQLLLDPNRRFIYVEMAFFARWWLEQSDHVKSQVKMLVDEGRLEFILGGWCMNDEAATHYNAIIDQMTLGMTFLNRTFGPCARPRVAWQIDPFGHSREQASLFAQMGFDGLFFGRLDFEDKQLREKELKMEEIWRGSESLDSPNADLFTGVNENGYGPPSGFCFDTYCADEPIMDDNSLEEFNVKDKVNFFVDAARRQAKHFKTNHIMMTMGSDFQYENAIMWFKNLDKLIKYVNAAKKNVTVFYSTPSCYLYALNQADKEWTVKTDDFFPYAERPHSFWTGYFTSRPGLKAYTRESNKFLQVCNQVEASSYFKNHQNTLSRTSAALKAAMGVAQHHDAVSGTSKQHVANDYAKRLYIGRESCKSVISEVISGSASQLTFCDYLNVTLCNYTQNMQQFTVIAYNPIGREISRYLRIPVDGSASFDVVDMATGNSVASELVPVTEATTSVRRNRGNAASELLFLATEPALGYQQYKVTKRSVSTNFLKKNPISKTKGDITISNEFYKVVFDGNSGLMKTVVNSASQIETMISQQLLWYNASLGNSASNQQSGAYVFRPNSTNPFHISADGKAEVKLVQSDNPLVQEVYQKFSDWAYQVVRLYKGKKFVEVEWTVGPIPVDDKWGKEIISRYDTPMVTNGYVYTDANGREVLERKYNYRPTWNLNQSEPVAGNYYPVNSRIYIKDSKYQLTVLTDRSQGGASLKNGSLELMVHRRLLGEDGKGVGEPLNETGQFGDGLIVRGKHWLLLDTITSSQRQHRLLAEEIFMSPLVAFQNVTSDTNTMGSGSWLVAPLPDNVHLLTLATTPDGVLIRLEHQFTKSDDAELSKPVTVSLKNLFKNFQPTSVEELWLGANAKKDDVTRLQWKLSERTKRENRVYNFERPYYDVTNDFQTSLGDNFDVTLQPMQIRTFLMK
ncbi:unnamed protein product [Clavelina lepadiformis]|uniref:Alpha-mannosidase n=1 Tax=Clavelina lepadiformis TaxID=159417 RepID=A0ABP0G7K0_CLALP